MKEDVEEIISLLKSIEKMELYTRQHSDPDTFFAANYQKDFNDKIDLMVQISDELAKKDRELKQELGKNKVK